MSLHTGGAVGYREDGPDPWDVTPEPEHLADPDDAAGGRGYRGRRRRPARGRWAARWSSAAVVVAVGVLLLGSGVLARSLSGPTTLTLLPPSPTAVPLPPTTPATGAPDRPGRSGASGVAPVRSPDAPSPAPAPSPTAAEPEPESEPDDEPATAGCRVEVDLVRWPGGFRADYTLTNTGSEWDGWTVEFRVRSGVEHEAGWDAFFQQQGRTITATNAPWNAGVGAGESVTFGHRGTRDGRVSPRGFEVDGTSCARE